MTPLQLDKLLGRVNQLLVEQPTAPHVVDFRCHCRRYVRAYFSQHRVRQRHNGNGGMWAFSESGVTRLTPR